VVSELVANAVEAHCRENLEAPVRLTLIPGQRAVLVVVRDASSGNPDPRASSEEAEDGRGLFIVDALSAFWNVQPVPGGGKAVRALIRVNPAAARNSESKKERSMPVSVNDEIDTRDRIYLEKLRLATDVLLQAGEEKDVLNDLMQTELFLLRDRVERALLLPEDASGLLA
jgi:hypothetical protein